MGLTMHTTVKAAVAALFLTSQSLFAGSFVRTSLDPVAHADATLVVVGADGTETAYSPADLEAMTTYSLTTRTPWRDEPATFEGVRLSDLLAANGLDLADAIRVTAENDYSTVIDRALLDTVDILVATRVDGRAHTRRARGPIQFVIDLEAHENSDLTSDSNLVWMVARIEAEG